MLEKHSGKRVLTMILAALVMMSFHLGSTPAYSEELDIFGVEKIYPTAGNEWYVNMNDPYSDPLLQNREDLTKQPDGSWQVSGGSNGQVRLEAWSPVNEKWLNVEITMYAKMVSGSNELLQLYSRGGHHTSSNECLGSAYKARLYGDGETAWNKELTHPAYAGNRAEMRATTQPLEDRWIGFKAVIYNFVENGHTYVRLESYIDDDVTDSNGNLVIDNDWRLASVYEDRGGWSTSDSDFDPSCGRNRDEILTQPGGTNTQNIAAFRSDDLTWNWKYLSVREINPSPEQPAPEEPEEPMPVKEPYAPEEPASPDVGSLCSNESCQILAHQRVQNDGSLAEVSYIDLNLKKSTSRTSGILTVAIVQGSDLLATGTVSTNEIQTIYETRTVQLGSSADVQGKDFDVHITYEGSGIITIASIAAK